MTGTLEVQNELIELIPDIQGKEEEGELNPVPYFPDICPAGDHLLYYYQGVRQWV